MFLFQSLISSIFTIQADNGHGERRASERRSPDLNICDPSGRNQSHVGRVRFPLRAEMHGRAHITEYCAIAFITSKICQLSYGQVSHMKYEFKYTKKAVFRGRYSFQ